MIARGVLFGLLLTVAAAAAVLSFAALRDLALSCGFSARLGWLLPVVVDAGAGAGSLVWLGAQVSQVARQFARVLALSLLTLSVAANALGHGLAAFGLGPAWPVVVVVSGIAPGVLGAVVHLAVLVGCTGPAPPVPCDDAEAVADGTDSGGEFGTDFLDENGLSRWWRVAPPASAGGRVDRAAELIAAGAGRRRLSRELGMSEYGARQLLARSRRNPDQGGTDTTDEESSNSDASEADLGPETNGEWS